MLRPSACSARLSLAYELTAGSVRKQSVSDQERLRHTGVCLDQETAVNSSEDSFYIKTVIRLMLHLLGDRDVIIGWLDKTVFGKGKV